MARILLVEDNDINREMLSRRLERKGYEVIVAINGAEGVAKTQIEQPDLVLMDLHLPVLNGWEATRQIRANPETQHISIVALTADANAGESEKALAAGCDDYETKPVDFTRLLNKIAKLLVPPAVSSIVLSSEMPDSPADRSLQRLLRSRLRHQLDVPIHNIIGYSNLLLDALSDDQNSTLCSDIQKIQTSALQLLKLVQAILNPVLVDIQQQDFAINLFASVLRRELLTPLSTIIGYCELLFEEASPDLVPDLEQIYSSAQNLLSMVNSLDSLITQPLQADDREDTDLERSIAIRQSIIPEDHRILVVDSHESSSALLSRQLERKGYQIAIANTPDQVLQTLAAISCHLILIDVEDLQLLKQIRSHEEWQHIPVLLIAVPDELETVVQGIAIGATDFISKPLQPVILYSKIATHLEHEQLRQQVETLQLELEQIKRGQQAAEMVQTQYFQQLQSLEEFPSLETSPLKVLLVEDNELNSDMLSRRLQRYGYEVVIANDGAEGVSKAISEQPHLILMDISLPIMDGWEATQKLKAYPETCRIPVIALTAHAMTGDREKALAAGCNDYDTKPIELPRLLSKIEACLKRSTTNSRQTGSQFS
ncbi:response regulator receiver protein [Leptolyngbya sp. NIES-3755]|nr:response regulator receiver protein [Leptolyngbya sp. NIES-3755]